MTAATLAIVPFDLRAASAREYAAENAFYNRIRAESHPDDPPVPTDERVRGWQNIPPFVDVRKWIVWGAGGQAIVAEATAEFLRTDENRHLLQFGIDVLPEYRRRGLGRRLLAPIVEVAQREGRRLLIAGTNDRVPAGEAFMRRLGARKGLENHTNQLDLADLDHNLLRGWLERADGAAARFELGFWPGAYPDDDLAAIAALHEILNGAPTDDLEIEDSRTTPEQLRQMEAHTFARGMERWTLYARERATGAFAGFTEVFWHPNRPALLDQGATGVFPQYRNHGLGRWLKAAMLDRVLRERPQVRFVRTGNADSNAAMLRINHQLGFKPYIAHCVWQVETDKVLDYLNSAA